MHLKLFIIDTIGPFFLPGQGKTINWSKIPFNDLQQIGHPGPRSFPRIAGRFGMFIKKAGELGYNALSMDDLAHLIVFPFYPEFLKKEISAYGECYRQLFRIARNRRFKIFINTDIMFFNAWIDRATRNRPERITELLHSAVKQLLQEFEVDGVIFRIGESDGVDVKGDFISRLAIKTPEQANRILSSLLPLFEQFKKLLIFRTWTVGIYPIGDLIWNSGTFERTFKNIDSRHFAVSMKFGDTDFYDCLKLNPLLFSSSHQKIVELQTRREREGFGEFPYYVGWQYHRYFKQINDVKEIMGISVWCQTGGWSRWKNFTYLKNSSMWNELNTFATIRIFRYRETPESALRQFLKNDKLARFVKLYHKTYRELLYIRGYSDKTFYVRRTRVPPLVWVFWDHVIINPALIALLDFTGQEKFNIPKHEIKLLYKMGKKINVTGIDYLCETLRVLAISRRILWKKSLRPRFFRQLRQYEKKYPFSYRFSILVPQSNYRLSYWFYKILLRTHAEYRWIDKIFITKPFSLLLRFLLLFLRKSMPAFVDRQAMKIDLLVK